MCLAIPGKLLSISDDEPLFRMGRVAFGGVVKQISLACTPQAEVGQYLLVHVGLAISVLDEDEAERILAALESLGETEGETRRDMGEST